MKRSDALRRAAACQDPAAPPWTLAWLSGLVNREQGHLAEAERDLRSVLEDKSPETLRRGFDFSRDYVVINELGLTLFTRAQQTLGERRKAERESLLQQAAAQFEKTLTLDSEDVTAHHNLSLIYAQLGDQAKADGASSTASALQRRRQCAGPSHCLGAAALSGRQSRGRSTGDLSTHQRRPGDIRRLRQVSSDHTVADRRCAMTHESNQPSYVSRRERRRPPGLSTLPGRHRSACGDRRGGRDSPESAARTCRDQADGTGVARRPGRRRWKKCRGPRSPT